ncbi:MAG: PhoPQ-activated pathogenicity-related family protein [Bryobacteraceae bacterium]
MRWLVPLFLAALLHAADITALDRYVAAPDDSFRYELAGTATVAGATVYTLDMVSQRFLTPQDVDRTEWRHWLYIVKPAKVETATGLLIIDGGSNPGKPAAPDAAWVRFAAETHAVVADLKMVPNQPLVFAGEERGRTEDSFIAYTWDKFLRTGDPRWPARLPMTKAAVRAMDAITAFCGSEQGGNVKVSRFVVAGGSKRGWTTWTTAAVDRRVAAIAPLVIDVPNVETSFIHHWRAYGFWAPAVEDYAAMGIMKWMGKPEFRALMEIEDPYEYRERLTMPKYVVNSSGDQFFLPDSSQFYFDRMPGEKYLRYVPNTDHSLENSDALESLLAWFQAVVSCTPRPRFYWNADRAQGTIRLRTLDPPSEVRMWKAINPEARDFRLERIGRAWTSARVEGAEGVYEASLPRPEQGFGAFFLELTYPGGMKFTTEVVVAPDVYPFGPPGE